MRYLFFLLTILFIGSCNTINDQLSYADVEITKANAVSFSTFVDPRDEQLYNTIVFDSIEWLNSDIRFETTYSYCYGSSAEEDNDCLMFYEKEKLTGQGPCPNGWRIPNYDDWYNLLYNWHDFPDEFVQNHLSLNGFNIPDNGSYDALNSPDLRYNKESNFSAIDNFERVVFFRVDGSVNFNIEQPWDTHVSCRCVRTSIRNVDPIIGINPTCNDGFQNGDETGVDCGGADCEPCTSCNDGLQNGDETGVDCGGTDCEPCASCNDGLQNGDETGIDCGGPECEPCLQYFTDSRDGKQYTFTQIGEQFWMTQNLNFTGAGICYQNDDDNCDKFGRLYTSAEANSNNICPEGWHLPTDEEFKELETFLGMPADELNEIDYFERGNDQKVGEKLKIPDEQIIPFSIEPSGFNTIGSGVAYTNSNGTLVFTAPQRTGFQTSTKSVDPATPNYYKTRFLDTDHSGVERWDTRPDFRISCRCVKD